MRTLLTLLLLLLLPFGAVMAQPGTDEQLAAQYFQQGDMERALLYYEKLYRKQPTDHYYEQLLKCYEGLKDLERAEKLVKEQVRKRDGDPRFLIDLGSVYDQNGLAEKADKEYEKALRMMGTDQNAVRQTANAFIRVNKLDLALEAYKRGQRATTDGLSYHYEMANVHALKGDFPSMVTAYMDLLALNEGYLQSVQNSLSRYLDFEQADGRTEILRTELLRRIQRDPQRTIFPELLIWMYVQQKDLEAAFIQSKAMDKRLDEGGQRLMDLAGIALANGDHATAFKCYDYVVSLGRNDGNYLQARIGAVRARYDQLTRQPEPDRTELLELDQRMAATIEELGVGKATIELIRERSLLKGFYLDDGPGAATLLQQAIDLPMIDNRFRARLKLDLGDVYLIHGDIWEASLLYSQVDLDQKYDLLGHEARLRNAKVSFYSGDFLWAQAQLDVLKASTSKLISNDAIELSLRISDNLGLDSNAVPLSFFARAELLRVQHQFDASLLVLDSLDAAYPMHSLGDDVLYERYRIAYARHRYTEAAGYLEKVLELYPLDILVDNAMLDLGILYEDALKDPEKAKTFYEKLLFEQTGSIFVPEARARYRKLRGDGSDLPDELKPAHEHP
jgi:tetratricopeptide (TPR) repeat protein